MTLLEEIRFYINNERDTTKDFGLFESEYIEIITELRKHIITGFTKSGLDRRIVIDIDRIFKNACNGYMSSRTMKLVVDEMKKDIEQYHNDFEFNLVRGDKMSWILEVTIPNYFKEI